MYTNKIIKNYKQNLPYEGSNQAIQSRISDRTPRHHYCFIPGDTSIKRNREEPKRINNEKTWKNRTVREISRARRNCWDWVARPGEAWDKQPGPFASYFHNNPFIQNFFFQEKSNFVRFEEKNTLSLGREKRRVACVLLTEKMSVTD